MVTSPIRRSDTTLDFKVLQRNDSQYAKVQVGNQRSDSKLIWEMFSPPLIHPHTFSPMPDKCEDPFSPQVPLRWENSIVCNVYSVNSTYLQSPPLPTPPFSLSIDTHWLLDCMDPPPFPQPHPQQLTKIMTCWKTINHFRVWIPEDSI